MPVSVVRSNAGGVIWVQKIRTLGEALQQASHIRGLLSPLSKVVQKNENE